MVEPSALTDLAGFPRTKSVEPVVAVVDGSVAVEEAVVPRTKSVAVASSSLLLDLCRLGMFWKQFVLGKLSLLAGMSGMK